MDQEAPRRVGILAADPLRAMGMEAIMGEVAGVETELLSTADVWARAAQVDALVLDARSVGASLPEWMARLRRDAPGARVIVLGESADPLHVQAVIGAGAKGYLPETATEAEVKMAVEVVLDGSVWAPRKVLARLIESGGTREAQAAAESVSKLMTPRELEVLELLKDGKSNRDIGDSLGIDETTVKAHLGRMLRKTGAANRVELTLRAMEADAAQE